jgi:hypothetical protein
MKALPSSLPEELWGMRDAVVEHFHANTPLPQDIERLHEWLEGHGWDILLESWVEEELVMEIEYLSSFFSDTIELLDAEGLESSDEINDEIRVEYARNWMSDKFEAGDDFYNIKSIHSCELKCRNGKSATIYCTHASAGQGEENVWYGAFATRQGFLNHIKGLGYWLTEDIVSMDDTTILTLWQKDS